MIGQTFGRLTVVEFSHLDARHRKHFRCRCSCGSQKTVQASLLRGKNTRSCGCLSREAKAAQRLPNNHGEITAILLQYQRHARDRSIPWKLSREDVDRIVRQPCHYCGEKAGNLKKTKNYPAGFPHNGIDRADSGRPYELGNVVACCGTCNKAKGRMSEAEFVSWAKRIAEQWGCEHEISIYRSGRFECQDCRTVTGEAA